MDIYTKEKRSEIMGRVRASNSKPEIIVRRLLHKLGYRFRLHRSDLPGKPDIVLVRYNAAIFVHGCFWHNHKDCKKSRLPKTNEQFWREKIMENVDRDKRSLIALKSLGWRVLVIWECEIKSPNLQLRLSEFLRQNNGNS